VQLLRHAQAKVGCRTLIHVYPGAKSLLRCKGNG